LAEENQNLNPYGNYRQGVQQEIPVYEVQPRKRKGLGIFWNIILFIFTFFSTTLAGVAWLNKDPYNLDNFSYGLTYSILIIFVLSCHEFGHYFAAKIHKVKVTLPFFIPFPFLFLNPFGTMGAVIRMKSSSRTRKVLFDIGIAGPVAGFIASLGVLVWGMTHLPPFEYIYNIHPEYASMGIPLSGFSFGQTLLYWGLSQLLTSSPAVFMPPMNEMYHYPFLCVGWFGLLITALNLLPVGQLDGGHITYALLGNKHKVIARVFFGFTLALGLIGLMQVLLFEFAGIEVLGNYGFLNWLIWAILMFFVIRLDHPPIYDPDPLDKRRKLWGVFALLMFLTSFTPVPFQGF
jgi:membrane-associated protease RseP (regulator of RpoE activity)